MTFGELQMVPMRLCLHLRTNTVTVILRACKNRSDTDLRGGCTEGCR